VAKGKTSRRSVASSIAGRRGRAHSGVHACSALASACTFGIGLGGISGVSVIE